MLAHISALNTSTNKSLTFHYSALQSVTRILCFNDKLRASKNLQYTIACFSDYIPKTAPSGCCFQLEAGCGNSGDRTRAGWTQDADRVDAGREQYCILSESIFPTDTYCPYLISYFIDILVVFFFFSSVNLIVCIKGIWWFAFQFKWRNNVLDW